MTKAEVIVPHQSYITLEVDAEGNRIHLRQQNDEIREGETTITVVGRLNLDLLIEALQECREALE